MSNGFQETLDHIRSIYAGCAAAVWCDGLAPQIRKRLNHLIFARRAATVRRFNGSHMDAPASSMMLASNWDIGISGNKTGQVHL